MGRVVGIRYLFCLVLLQNAFVPFWLWSVDLIWEYFMCSLRVLIKHSCVEAHVGGVYLERVMRVPVMSVGVPFPCVSIGGSVWV